MGSRTALAAALMICGVAGCGRDHMVACEATARYASAASAPPVRIPDDLSPPDETNSLRLPPDAGAAAPIRPCLENPPGFFAEGAPGGTRVGNAPVRATPPPPVAPARATPPPPVEPARATPPPPVEPAQAPEASAAEDDPDRRIAN